jgi:hypothetical protein
MEDWGEVMELVNTCKSLDPSNGRWWLVAAYALRKIAEDMPEENRR